MVSEAVKREFAPAHESVEWANEAIDELHTAFKGFFQSGVTEVVTEFDAATSENVQKVRLTKPLPKAFRRKATEALTQARYAFDKATFAARNLATGRSNRSIYYPWARGPADLNRLLKARGIDQRLWDVFADHEPYPRGDSHPGGDDVIRTLAKMANDKHTVGLTVIGHITSTRYPSIHGRVVQSMDVLVPRWNPQKNEAELIRWRGDVEVNGDYEFSFDVALRDTRLPEPVNAIAALKGFSEKASLAAETLEARCQELGLG
ncbi:hypothetical protein [Maricaulis sp.]|uniref:hypothetical protein n=1 Tax=Maricaulis sp. TaxID=1486257 RepID=UPI00263459DC|nr:hypothetical protein [Maricaulis sp.]